MERASLLEASVSLDDEERFFKFMERSMGGIAGRAIGRGYDDLASEAAQLITELQEDDPANE